MEFWPPGNAQEENNQQKAEAEQAGDSFGQGMAQGLRGDKARNRYIFSLEWQTADRIDITVPDVTFIQFYTGVELFEPRLLFQPNR